MNILVVAAHPDDEVLGCGGTLCRHSEEGHHVFVVYMAQGIMSRFQEKDIGARNEAVGRLKEDARKAADILGIEGTVFFDFPDNRMDHVDLLDVVRGVESCLDRFHPSIVYSHHEGDLNIDHSIVARAVITATRPQQEQTVEEVYAFEVLSSTEWAFHQPDGVFSPNCFVGMEAYLDRKLEAMAAYQSEVRRFPSPRSLESIRYLARLRGSQAGLEAAEAFRLIRRISR
jgi:N-acetylglucosamine malate deacetylase 1